jgi:hypothetical protein
MKLQDLLRHGHYMTIDDNPPGVVDDPVEDTPAPPDNQPANEPWRDELKSIRGEFGEIKGMLQGLVSQRQPDPDTRDDPAPDEYPDEWEQQFSSRIKESVRKDTNQIVAEQVRAALSEVLTPFQAQQARDFLGGDAARDILGDATDADVLAIVNRFPKLAETIREKTGANKPRPQAMRTAPGGDYPDEEGPSPEELRQQEAALRRGGFSEEAMRALKERRKK